MEDIGEVQGLAVAARQQEDHRHSDGVGSRALEACTMDYKLCNNTKLPRQHHPHPSSAFRIPLPTNKAPTPWNLRSRQPLPRARK